MLSPASPELKGSRVLLVDDDPVNLIVLAGVLSEQGYQLVEAESGESALAQCDSILPDLILLDVRLPGIDGFATCREIQRRYGTDSPPVIFITARDTPQDILDGFAVGGVDYLTKPVSERETIARIKTHLSNRLLVKQLGQTISQKNKLLGMAAHDLRNPLASILGMAELLREGVLGALTQEQREAAAMFADVSRNMLHMVNELLDVSVIEAGQFKITTRPTNLTELISKSVYMSGITAARKKTVIVFDASDEAVYAPVDAAKIRQVVDNLVSNAVKYSPLASTITLSLRRNPTSLCFAVRDMGPGIPEQERSKLFKEFGTLSVQSTAGEKSTGLGLAICRRIVEAHQGTITAVNLPARGCEFSVTIPIP